MSGSETEFIDFVEARSAALLRTACLLTAGDRHAAEDLLQTALAKAFVSWGRIQKAGATEAYVRTILTRSAIDRRRSRRWDSEVLTGAPSDVAPGRPSGALSAQAAGSATDGVDDRMAVWGMLRSLPPRQRAVVVLRYYEDLSEEQIADVLGCSRGTVKSHASRALDALRTQLRREGPSIPARTEGTA